MAQITLSECIAHGDDRLKCHASIVDTPPFITKAPPPPAKVDRDVYVMIDEKGTPMLAETIEGRSLVNISKLYCSAEVIADGKVPECRGGGRLSQLRYAKADEVEKARERQKKLYEEARSSLLAVLDNLASYFLFIKASEAVEGMLIYSFVKEVPKGEEATILLTFTSHAHVCGRDCLAEGVMENLPRVASGQFEVLNGMLSKIVTRGEKEGLNLQIIPE